MACIPSFIFACCCTWSRAQATVGFQRDDSSWEERESGSVVVCYAWSGCTRCVCRARIAPRMARLSCFCCFLCTALFSSGWRQIYLYDSTTDSIIWPESFSGSAPGEYSTNTVVPQASSQTRGGGHGGRRRFLRSHLPRTFQPHLLPPLRGLLPLVTPFIFSLRLPVVIRAPCLVLRQPVQSLPDCLRRRSLIYVLLVRVKPSQTREFVQAVLRRLRFPFPP